MDAQWTLSGRFGVGASGGERSTAGRLLREVLDSGRGASFNFSSDGISELLGFEGWTGGALGLPSPVEPHFLDRLAKVTDWGRLSVVTGTGRATRRHLTRPFDESLVEFSRIFGSSEELYSELEFDEGLIRISNTPMSVLLYVQSQLVGGSVSSKWTEEGPWLRDVAGRLGAKTVWIRPRLVERRDSGSALWRGFDLQVEWEGGVTHSQVQLSFGQKRLIAFYWNAELGPGTPLLTDELTNGLHSSWVDDIVTYLDERQAFHAVQNPLLVDRTGLGTEEQILGQFVFCDVVSDSGRQWTWRNPTMEEASELRSAWHHGIQSLSEVLRSRGLW